MNSEELADRTQQFAIDVIKTTNNLPYSLASQVILKQLIRSATSIGANYREACMSRSRTEFLSKLGVCKQEANETVYWLELMDKLNLTNEDELQRLLDESKELLSIFIASTKTMKTTTPKP